MIKTFLFSLISLGFISLALAQPNVVYAAGGSFPPDNSPSTTASQDVGISLKISNPAAFENVQELMAAILSAVVQIAIPFLVLAIMYVGFLFVAARGNPGKLAEARQALFYVLLGALIILGSETLSRILSGTIKELTNIN